MFILITDSTHLEFKILECATKSSINLMEVCDDVFEICLLSGLTLVGLKVDVPEHYNIILKGAISIISSTSNHLLIWLSW